MIPGSANPLLLTSADSGFALERSLRFNSSDSSHLSRTPSATGNRKTWTWSSWVKRSKLGTDQTLFSADQASGTWFIFQFDTSDRLMINWTAGTGGAYQVTTAKFRDPSAWYHLVLAFDTTQSTDTDKIKLYVNGVLFEERDVVGYPSTNTDYQVNNGNKLHKIGTGAHNVDLYLADVHFIDGQALAPTDFGETDDNGVWQPKKFEGSYTQEFAENWGSQVTGSAIDAGRAISMTFDGDASTRSAAAAGTTLTFTPTSPITGISAVIIKADRDSGASSSGLVLNGTNISSNWSSGTSEQTISVNNLTSLSWQTAANSQWWGVYYIKVVKNGVTYELLQRSSSTFNSFHLDFADNSSNAALGTDTSGISPANTWTVNNLSLNKPAINVGTISSVGSGAALPIYASWQYGGQSFNAPLTGMSAQSTGGMTFLDTSSQWVWLLDATIGDGTAVVSRSGGQENFQILGTNDGQNYTLITTLTGSQTYTLDKNFGYTYAAGRMSGSYGSGNIQQTITNGSSPVLSVPNTNNISVGDVVQDPVEITAIDTSNNTVTVNGGNWYGSDGSGTSGGSTVLSTAALTTGDNFVDTPTNGTQTDTGAGGEVVGNYATLNPLNLPGGGTLSDGNLKITGAGGYDSCAGTIAVSSGKWYFEVTPTSGAANGMSIGITKALTTSYIGDDANSYGYWIDGEKYNNGNSASYGASWTNSDVIGVAFDADAGTVTFYKNGASQGVAYSSLSSGTWFLGLSPYGSASATVNFGQRAFAYTAPSGYKALNTSSLPTPTIADGSLYFDTKLYTGNSSTNAITGLNMSPDFVWLKSRSQGFPHWLFDTIRGTEKELRTDTNAAEGTNANTLTSFNSDGFTLGSNVIINNSGQSMVGWAWDAGSSNTTIAAGSLNSSAYNQSQTWSSSTGITDNSGTRSSAYIFDGVITGSHSNGFNTYNSTITLANSVTATSSIRFYGAFENASGVRYTVNGTTTDAQPPEFSGNTAFGWASVTNVSFPVTINNVGLTDSSTTNGGRFVGIEIDGKLLVDYGVTPPTNVPSIASTVRTSASSGFSIVSYTGTGAAATIAHNLNAKPEFYIVKRRDGAISWCVYHSAIAATKYLFLDGTAAADTSSTVWNNTEPTASVFSVGTYGGVSANSGEYIGYFFSPVEGFSSVGSFVGNGSTDGPFVYTGFKVSWIMMKRTDTAGYSWFILDATRSPYNDTADYLIANSSGAEADNTTFIDILSNGFKLRDSGATPNGSGGTYVYLAFASNPFASNGGLAR